MATRAVTSTLRCNASKVKIGSVFTRHSFGVVEEINGEDYILRNDQNKIWKVEGNALLEAEFSFADQYGFSEKKSRTEINEIIAGNPRTAMTICYRKKPNHTEIAKKTSTGKPDGMSDRKWSSTIKAMIAGEERVMVGYHTNSFDAHQRLQFIEHDTGPRLVDTRTVEWVIVNQVRFVIK